ncbi:MAG TPA: DUF4145 domain-containing protein [Candidatus Nanoarchaeia archaeon]|nr:DUF4145 domain-containing protein [Candidatus Nanoarchaeia archaeon]
MEFHKNLVGLQNAVAVAKKNKINLSKGLDDEKSVYDYGEKQRVYYLNNVRSHLRLVKAEALQLPPLIKFDTSNQEAVTKILELIPELESTEITSLEKTVAKLLSLVKQLNMPKDMQQNFSLTRNIPLEIKADIGADIAELNKCFNTECYRSSIILCGRILETALHRKYFEATGNDLLEKSPGIGLGNIIAKLKEQNVSLDPALSNQIHLLNQVRVFSVHKKKEAFTPTQQQTHAIILYTLDVLEKLF